LRLNPFAGPVAAPKVASRRRAEAALWRAAKAEGLAHSMTLRVVPEPPRYASRFGLRRVYRRFSSGGNGIFLRFLRSQNATLIGAAIRSQIVTGSPNRQRQALAQGNLQ
jgi:hypothetical protein